jgi:uncharacterized protein YbjT (DUF2867 family)
MHAIVIGSTGLTGRFVIRELLMDPAITKVTSVSRKPLGVTNAKFAEVVIADLAELPSVVAKLRGDGYFSCLGTTIKAAGSQAKFEAVDHDANVAFATIARDHDAKSFALVSAMGANARSRIFYNRVKGRTEDDITALGLRSLVIFRPALLAGPREESRAAEQLATRIIVPVSRVLPVGLRKSLVTEAVTLAKRMVEEGRAMVAGVRIIGAKEI